MPQVSRSPRENALLYKTYMLSKGQEKNTIGKTQKMVLRTCTCNLKVEIVCFSHLKTGGPSCITGGLDCTACMDTLLSVRCASLCPNIHNTNLSLLSCTTGKCKEGGTRILYLS